MPFLLAVVPYLLIEAVTFWAVATWIGVGWALLTVFILMAVGIVAAGVEMQRVGRSAAARRISPGRMAGDYGLLTVGAILAGLPGIASSVLGLLLIFPPTRAIARKVLAKKLVKSVEDFGVRSFEATNAYRTGASYGTFGDPEGGPSGGTGDSGSRGTIIDVDEIDEWTRTMRPEDFRDPGDDRGETPGDTPGDKR